MAFWRDQPILVDPPIAPDGVPEEMVTPEDAQQLVGRIRDAMRAGLPALDGTQRDAQKLRRGGQRKAGSEASLSKACSSDCKGSGAFSVLPSASRGSSLISHNAYYVISEGSPQIRAVTI